ncbi:MAG: hypothetical protein IPI61_08415 [Syntrophaceae bacterium]|jgi:hypothetical protein|nr:hypothetical protein [Syntrophaceae bacterium]
MKAGKIFFIVLMVFLAGCAHYSVTSERTEEENTIVAPIEVVWQKTLDLLPNERISVTTSDISTYTIKARKSVTFWSWGDDVTIKLYPRSPQKTIVHIEAHPALGTTLVGWGHQERMTVSLFEKIKSLSEAAR